MYHLWALQPRLYQWSFRSISAFDQIIANCSSYQTGGFIYFWANNGFLKWGFQVKHYHRLKACGCASLQSSARAIPAPPSIPQDSQSPWHFHLSWAISWERFLQLNGNSLSTESLLRGLGLSEVGRGRVSLAVLDWGVVCVCLHALSQTFIFIFL